MALKRLYICYKSKALHFFPVAGAGGLTQKPGAAWKPPGKNTFLGEALLLSLLFMDLEPGQDLQQHQEPRQGETFF